MPDYYWDNAASYSLVSSLDQFSQYFKLTKPVDFGTQNKPVFATHIGFCILLPQEYSAAFWGPSFTYTILSLGYLQRKGWNYRTSGDQLIITDPSGNVIDTPTLTQSNMLPVTRPISHLSSHCLATPTTQPSAAFISKLDAAEALHHQFNHPSDDVLAAAITNGSITTTVTPADILNNRKHRGPCLACSNGKLRDTPHPPSPYPPSPRPGHTLVLDINEIKDKSVGGNAVSIHCVDTYSTRYDVAGSATKTTRDVFMAIVTIVATAYNAFRHLVEIIYTDSEAVFRALQALLGSIGIQLLLANPIDHNRFFERYKQTLGMRFYSTLASLPYHLPPAYYLQLAADTAFKHNCLPNSKTGNSCPWTIVTGKTPPRPKGTFGGVYMITSSIQQRTYLAKNSNYPSSPFPNHAKESTLARTPCGPLPTNSLFSTRKSSLASHAAFVLTVFPSAGLPNQPPPFPIPTLQPLVFPSPSIPSPPPLLQPCPRPNCPPSLHPTQPLNLHLHPVSSTPPYNPHLCPCSKTSSTLNPSPPLNPPLPPTSHPPEISLPNPATTSLTKNQKSNPSIR